MATTKKTKKPTTTNKSSAKTTAKKSSDAMETTSMTASMPSALQNKRTVAALFVLGAIAALLIAFRGEFVVATVNGTPITRAEVIKELESQAGASIVDGIISEKLLLQEAQKEGIDVSQEEIDQKIDSIRKDIEASGQSLDDILEAQGLTLQDVQDQTRLQLTLEKLLADVVSVTDEEVEEAFESQAELMTEDMTEEEFKEQIRQSLSEQKLSFEAQTLIQDLQSNADIQYWKQY